MMEFEDMLTHPYYRVLDGLVDMYQNIDNMEVEISRMKTQAESIALAFRELAEGLDPALYHDILTEVYRYGPRDGKRLLKQVLGETPQGELDRAQAQKDHTDHYIENKPDLTQYYTEKNNENRT